MEENAKELGLPSLGVQDITPAVGPIDGGGDCVRRSGARAVRSFDSDGGTEPDPTDRLAGSPVTGLPRPGKASRAFDGWRRKPSCEGGRVESLVMPREDMMLCAKWSSNTYQISFHINGGAGSTPGTMEAVFDRGGYGALPVVRRTGERLAARTGGRRVKRGDPVKTTKDQTPCAHWGAWPWGRMIISPPLHPPPAVSSAAGRTAAGK